MGADCGLAGSKLRKLDPNPLALEEQAANHRRPQLPRPGHNARDRISRNYRASQHRFYLSTRPKRLAFEHLQAPLKA